MKYAQMRIDKKAEAERKRQKQLDSDFYGIQRDINRRVAKCNASQKGRMH